MRKLIASVMSLVFCVTLIMSVCPAAFADDGGIKKLQVQTYQAPVAMMDVSSIVASTCTTNCVVTSYGWFKEDTGEPLSGQFGPERCRIEITVYALNSRFFSSEVYVTLNGDPADFVVSEDRTAITLYRVYAPDVWAPYIMDDVFSESVKAGGYACFDARAEYAESCVWYFYDSYYHTPHYLNELAAIYPDVSYDDSTPGVVYIYNIPAEMNGCEFMAVFNGMGGSCPTSKATLYVKAYQDAYTMPYYPPITQAAVPETSYESAYAEAAPENVYSADADAQSIVAQINDYSADYGDAVDSYLASFGAEGSGSTPELSKAVQPTAALHEHSFISEWKYDNRQHFVECECGARDCAAAHSMVWTVTKEPTLTQNGNKIGVCSVCGYKRDVPIVYTGAEKAKIINLRDASASGILESFAKSIPEGVIILIVLILFFVPALAVIITLRKEEAHTGKR